MITDNDPIILENYNSAWPGLYESEAQLLKHALGDTIVGIEHIGSTAVPGLAAKPVIDIQIAVASLSDASEYAKELSKLGYQHTTGDEKTANFFFCKGAGHKAHQYHLYIVESGSDEQMRRIVFRDYLRGNPRGAQEYEALKRAMAEKFPDDRSAYVDAKTAFVTLALCMYAGKQE